MPWTHFTLDEFRCHGTNCCGGAALMDESFIDKLDKLRAGFGFAFPINSGYRCPKYNAQVSSTGLTGPHTTGRAVDIGIFGMQAFVVQSMAMHSAEFTGIGVKQHGPQVGRFLHLDDLRAPAYPRPTIWSYP